MFQFVILHSTVTALVLPNDLFRQLSFPFVFRAFALLYYLLLLPASMLLLRSIPLFHSLQDVVRDTHFIPPSTVSAWTSTQIKTVSSADCLNVFLAVSRSLSETTAGWWITIETHSMLRQPKFDPKLFAK